MVNYTSTGLKHIKAPDDLYNILKAHWELKKDKKKKEVWANGNINTNNWEEQTKRADPNTHPRANETELTP